MKKLLCILLMLALLLAGCAKQSAEATAENSQQAAEETLADEGAQQAADDNGMWRVEILVAEAADELSGTQSVVQYSGEVEKIETDEQPKSGHLFLLMELLVDKLESGRSAFSWDNAYVEDGEGNKYSRHQNDTFLESYKLPRLKSVELSIGSNQGYVCYEVPVEAASGDLWFVYEGDEGAIKIKIHT